MREFENNKSIIFFAYIGTLKLNSQSMAKPRIFVSSTYYDLKHIRASLEAFINSFGYEPVLFESGDIGFSHDKPLDQSCYNEIKNSHMQILIIGGSYGSAESGTILTEEEKKDQYFKFNSITKKEFEVANNRRIPIYFFVENSVLSEFATYKKNKHLKTINYASVSSVNIFELIEEIYGLHNGNFIKGFSKFEDISEWLKSQWAHLMTEFISNRTDQIELNKISNSVQELNNISKSLKAYTEAILNNANPAEFEKVKSEQENIEQNRILQRFYSNQLIRHLRRMVVESDSEIYEIFQNSTTIKGFLAGLQLKSHNSDTERLDRLSSRPIAKHDYYSLKSYVNKEIDTEKYLELMAERRKFNFISKDDGPDEPTT